MQKIIYCPVCGSNIRTRNVCPGCGYEKIRDYEVYPTLGVIPGNSASIPAKRQSWEDERLHKAVNEALQSMQSDLKKQIAELEQRIHRIEEEAFSTVGRKTTGKTVAGTSPARANANSEGRISSFRASISDPKPRPIFISIKNNTCTFGSYPQESDGTVRPILWRVLKVDKANNKALLISKYALDCQPYNTTRKDVTWETCTLRNWLNSTFLSTAFSAGEREMIPKVIVSADSNPDYITAAQGRNTKDQIFLLSIPEAVQYFSTDKERQCAPTAYAIEQGAFTSSKYKQDGRYTGWWWLRSMSSSGTDASDIYIDGYVSAIGVNVISIYVGVRPALWINLDTVTIYA